MVLSATLNQENRNKKRLEHPLLISTALQSYFFKRVNAGIKKHKCNSELNMGGKVLRIPFRIKNNVAHKVISLLFVGLKGCREMRDEKEVRDKRKRTRRR